MGMQKTQNFIPLVLNMSKSVNGMMPSTDKMKMIYLNSIEDDVGKNRLGKSLLHKNHSLKKLLYQKKGVTNMLMKAPVGISLLI